MNDGPFPPALDDPPLPSSSSSSTTASTSSSTGSARDHVESALNIGGGDDETAPRIANNSSDDTPGSRVSSKCHLKLLELLNTFDSLVYMELAALYYLDTSTILVILRTLIHLTQISHSRTLALARASRLNLKPARTNIFLVLSINLVAIFIHAFIAPAEASEATRGYLHGHLIVDLIGQKAADGWLGRVKLCLLDCLVGLLQIIAVGIVGEVDRAEAVLARVKHNGRPTGTQPDVVESVTEGSRDHNTVEAGLDIFGIRTRQRQHGNENERNSGTELQDLTSAGATSVLGEIREGVHPQEVEPEEHNLVEGVSDDNLRDLDRVESASQILENFSSGQVILIRLRLLDLLRDHFWDWRNRRLAGRV